MNSTLPAVSASPTRLVALEGGCNFRDIGGYSAADGRTVKWGQVYRAGVLTYFTPADHGPLQQLGVRAICDLRRDEERHREPGRWPDSAAEALFWKDDENMPTVRGFAAKRPKTAAGMRDAMIELYTALPLWMAPRLRGLFECVSTGKLPVVVHCAAGKDRTGVAIAVLLRALGVETATVVEDYLLTNEAGNFETFIQTHSDSHLGLADAHRPLLSMPKEMRTALFAADADYLQAAHHQIDTVHGGLDAYLRNVLGLSDDTIEKTRQALLN